MIYVANSQSIFPYSFLSLFFVYIFHMISAFIKIWCPNMFPCICYWCLIHRLLVFESLFQCRLVLHPNRISHWVRWMRPCWNTPCPIFAVQLFHHIIVIFYIKINTVFQLDSLSTSMFWFLKYLIADEPICPCLRSLDFDMDYVEISCHSIESIPLFGLVALLEFSGLPWQFRSCIAVLIFLLVLLLWCVRPIFCNVLVPNAPTTACCQHSFAVWSLLRYITLTTAIVQKLLCFYMHVYII